MLVNPEHPTPTGRDHGGIATFVYNLATALGSVGNRVHVFVREGIIPDPLPSTVRLHYFGHERVRRPFSFLHGDSVDWEIGCSHALRTAVLRLHDFEQIDIVEIPEYGGLAIAFNPPLPFPVVVHFHTPCEMVDRLNNVDADRVRSRTYRLESRALRNAAGFKCTSESLKKRLRTYFSIPPNRVMVIRNPMSTEAFDVIEKKTGGAQDRINILFSGRLERRKGAELLVRFVNEILDLDHRVNLTIAGETETGESLNYRMEMENRIRTENRDRVWFLGALSREQIYVLYRRSTIFLFPSLFDNAPNALFEAIAAGLPVIAADAGGVDEIIRHGETGLLFPLDDPVYLIKHIRMLIQDCDFAETLAHSAYADLKKHYSPTLIANKTQQFYRSIQLPCGT